MAKNGQKKRKKHLTFEKRRSLTGYLFLAPWLFGGIFLLAFPLLFSFALSFSELQNYTTYAMEWVGFENYKRAFFGDINYITCITWVLQKTIYDTPIITVFSLIVAIIISREIKGKGFFRSIFFLPVLLGGGFVMQELLEQGVANSALEATRDLLLSPQVQSYLPAEVFDTLTDFLNSITSLMWNSGVQIILFLIGIQKIPQELYEAARVDSATEWEIFWKITLPMISPIILLVIVYTIISANAEYGPVISYIMWQGFDMSEFEYAAAMGWSFFAVMLVIIGLVFLVMKPFINRVTKRD